MKINFEGVKDKYTPLQQPIPKGEGRFFCSTCRKTLDERQFFKTNREGKYQMGYLPECKSCATMAIDDNDPSTFLSLLKEIDVPYIPTEWRKLLVKKDPKGGSIFGKYVSKMRINQFKKYRWRDSAKLLEEETEDLMSVLRQQTNSETEAEAEVDKLLSIENVKPEVETRIQARVTAPSADSMYGLTPETSKYGLTQKEITELQMRWGTDYDEEQYLRLEQLYNDLQEAYIIQDPIAIQNAQTICKMNLKLNKFLDIDDIESVSKLSRQYDLFVKTANLAPIQQKDRQQTTFAISQLAYLIEKEGGFIPKYYTKEPKDKIDEILKDMEDYTRSLIKGEPALETMVENAEQLLAAEKDRPDLDPTYDYFDEFEQEILGDLAEIDAESEVF